MLVESENKWKKIVKKLQDFKRLLITGQGLCTRAVQKPK